MDSPQAPLQTPIEPALRALAERQHRDLGPHPETDKLIAYYEESLPNDSMERVRDHLTLCPECAGRLLDLDGFHDHEASPDDTPDAEAETAWRELAPRLREEEPKASLVRFPEKVPPPVLPWALAAALLLALLGAGARMANLQHQVGDLQKPQAEAVVAHLKPVDDSTRSAEGPPPAFSRSITVVLVPPPRGWQSAVDVEMREAGASGPPLWASPVKPDDKGDLIVTLPPRSVRPGTYRLCAYGFADGKRLPPVEYELAVAP